MNRIAPAYEIIKKAVGHLALLAALAMMPQAAHAHGIAGQRFFPTTFAVDDPFVSDEFSLLYGRMRMPGGADGPSVDADSLSVELSKRITPLFGITLAETYQHNHTVGGGTARGFGNLEATAKYQFFTSDEHETILSAGLSGEIGHTGEPAVSEPISTISPQLYFGKGFGDLPEAVKYLRPLAITGVVGPNFPSRSYTDDVKNPTTLTWAFSVQYSLLYLQSFVTDAGLVAPFNRMAAIVEFPMETCLNGDCKNQTTGTVNPGFAWIGKRTELGLAARIPVNDQSRSHVGVFALFHLFLDDMFPTGLGRPVFP